MIGEEEWFESDLRYAIGNYVGATLEFGIFLTEGEDVSTYFSAILKELNDSIGLSYRGKFKPKEEWKDITNIKDGDGRNLLHQLAIWDSYFEKGVRSTLIIDLLRINKMCIDFEAQDKFGSLPKTFSPRIEKHQEDIGKAPTAAAAHVEPVTQPRQTSPG